MNKSSFRMAAAGCYAICALILLLSNIIYRYMTYSFDDTLGIVLLFIGLILISASYFADFSVLRWIGAGMSLLACILSLRIHILYYLWWGSPKASIISNDFIAPLVLILYWVLFIICNKKEQINKLFFAAASLPLLRLIISAATYDRDFGLSVWHVSFFSAVFYIALSAACILLGLSYSAKIQMQDVDKKITSIDQKKTVVDSTQSVIERLEKLKRLLDQGIITNEEFEAKKEKILNR